MSSPSEPPRSKVPLSHPIPSKTCCFSHIFVLWVIHGYIVWLVVYLPLWKVLVSWDDDYSQLNGKINMFQTSNQLFIIPQEASVTLLPKRFVYFLSSSVAFWPKPPASPVLHSALKLDIAKSQPLMGRGGRSRWDMLFGPSWRLERLGPFNGQGTSRWRSPSNWIGNDQGTKTLNTLGYVWNFVDGSHKSWWF